MTTSKGTEIERIWEEVLIRLRQEGGSASLEAHLADAVPLRLESDRLVVRVRNDFVRERLEREYGPAISEALSKSTGTIARLAWESADPLPERSTVASTPPTPEAGETHANRVQAANLNSEYTMASFIVGKSNAYPHALAKSVCVNAGKNYNPLYFYGGVGLGKTHLMQAIGHEILKNRPKARVRYVSSEVFHNEYIECIQNKKAWDHFRSSYRNIDCLLLDDVQFFESGERIQEEFHHTYNALYNASKQIVLTSDKQPHELQKLEERLRSRFGSGVVAKLDPPDIEMREAILTSRASEEQLAVPVEVIRYIAEKVTRNIRELRAVFRTVVAKASVLGEPLSTALVDEVLLSTTAPQKPNEITTRMIQDEICKLFGLRQDELTGRRRDRRVVVPRQIGMYLARELGNRTLVEIGEAFGKKDHTTVIHACTTIEEKMKADQSIRENVERIRIRMREQIE